MYAIRSYYDLSGKELANPSFANQVADTLRDFEVDPSWLRFEVTPLIDRAVFLEGQVV